MKIILVTGASGGIGEAVVNRLAGRKHNLLLVARNAQKLEEQCTKLRKDFGIHADFIAADLSKNGTAQEIFEATQKRNLEVTMLINNAGVGSGGEFSSLSLKSELDLIQLNVSSLVALTHLFYLICKSVKKVSSLMWHLWLLLCLSHIWPLMLPVKHSYVHLRRLSPRNVDLIMCM